MDFGNFRQSDASVILVHCTLCWWWTQCYFS